MGVTRGLSAADMLVIDSLAPKAGAVHLGPGDRIDAVQDGASWACRRRDWSRRQPATSTCGTGGSVPFQNSTEARMAGKLGATRRWAKATPAERAENAVRLNAAR